jgi:hypothetical protein
MWCTGIAGIPQQSPDEAGSCGICHSRQILALQPRFLEGPLDHRQEFAYMVTRGQLGHYTTIGCMNRDLAIETLTQ